MSFAAAFSLLLDRRKSHKRHCPLCSSSYKGTCWPSRWWRATQAWHLGTFLCLRLGRSLTLYPCLTTLTQHRQQDKEEDDNKLYTNTTMLRPAEAAATKLEKKKRLLAAGVSPSHHPCPHPLLTPFHPPHMQGDKKLKLLKKGTGSSSSSSLSFSGPSKKTTTDGAGLRSPPTVALSSASSSTTSNNGHDEDTWEGCWQGSRRHEAVQDGVAWLLKHAASTSRGGGGGEEGGEGGSIVPVVGQLVRLTRDPVRQEVLEAAHPALEKWKAENVKKRWEPVSGSGSSSSSSSSKKAAVQRGLIQAFRRIVHLEGTGVYAQGKSKQDLLDAFVSVEGRTDHPPSLPFPTSSSSATAQQKWSIIDYLGWNPLAGPPPESMPDPFDLSAGGRKNNVSRHRVLALGFDLMLLVELSGLVRDYGEEEQQQQQQQGEEEEEGEEEGLALYEEEEEEAEKAGGGTGRTRRQHRALSAECRVVHVLKWLPLIRPYLGPTLIEEEGYRDQVLLATSVVWALSRGGELRIPALLLPHEYFFLREHLAVQLLKSDVLLVGRSIDALRVLGSHDENPMMRAGMSFLLDAQARAGNWPASTAAAVKKKEQEQEQQQQQKVASTLAATRALLVREFNGFGPMPLEVIDLLLAWQKEDADPIPPTSSSSSSNTKLPSEEEDWSVVFLQPDGKLDSRVKSLGRVVTKIKKEQKKKQADAAAAATAAEAEATTAAAAAAAARAAAAAALVAPSMLLPSSSTSSFGPAGGGRGGGVGGEGGEGGGEGEAAPVLSEADQARAARIVRLGKEIERAKEEKEWGWVLEGLRGVEGERMTLALLSVTSIGRVVNKLKKVEDAAVAELGKKLVKEWKALVEEK